MNKYFSIQVCNKKWLWDKNRLLIATVQDMKGTTERKKKKRKENSVFSLFFSPLILNLRFLCKMLIRANDPLVL